MMLNCVSVEYIWAEGLDSGSHGAASPGQSFHPNLESRGLFTQISGTVRAQSLEGDGREGGSSREPAGRQPWRTRSGRVVMPSSPQGSWRRPS